MKKKFIIKKNTEFQDIFKQGKTISNANFIIYYHLNQLNYNRFGYAVSKKNYGAVQRNKIRRQLKMMVHQINNEHNFKIGYDIVIITTKNFVRNIFYQNYQLLLKLLLRIK